ncbi:MAG TPA: hypothetical protein VK400_08870 [Pyrinomonadaceae bacterium]|nr:hypothetical protein [Pyrinomonadaceae bacterium]
MFKKIIRTSLLIFSFFIVPTLAQERTDVGDARAKALLLGRHRLSLQWISWDYFGAATVSERDGVLYLKGNQRKRGGTDFLTVDGVITSVDAKEFSFSGKIVTQISHINGGAPCVREGDFTFKITGKRKYWRLQQIDNPCDAVADYVDIFLR